MFALKVGKKFLKCRSFARMFSAKHDLASGEGLCSNDPLEVLTCSSLSYQDMFLKLHEQAQRSMLLYVDANPNANQLSLIDSLTKFCSQLGNVLYLQPVSNSSNHFIVEYSTGEGVLNLSNMCTEGSLNLRIAKLSPSGLGLEVTTGNRKSRKEGNKQDLVQRLRSAGNMSEQMDIYFKNLSASSDDLRKRLFLPSLFQDFFNWHMKTDFTAVPFGTTIMGISTTSSDLDISLTNLKTANNTKMAGTICSLNELPTKSAQLYTSLHRSGANSLFGAACKEIHKHFPGVDDLNTHDAVVPLITFKFSPFSTNVDISMDNKPGMQTGWIFNMYTRMDERVAPFLFLLRQWGKQNNIVERGSYDYDGMTPFMLTCLGIFYLMRVRPAVIPTMKQMLSGKSSPNDLILGKFRTKINTSMLEFQSENTSSVEELFVSCLEYYRKFDFAELTICLSTGITSHIPTEHLRVTIPVTSNNVGKQCKIRNLRKFQSCAETLLRRLEGRKRHKHDNWGILSAVNAPNHEVI